MTEKFNFDNIADDAIKNEPERSLSINIADSKEETKPEFEFKAEFLISSILEIFSYYLKRIFGSGLNEAENNGLNSFLDRSCKYFGLQDFIGGLKGFTIELFCRVIALIIPRLKTEKEKEENEYSTRGNDKRASSNNGLTTNIFQK